MQVGADRLFPAVRAEPRSTVVAATGVSCRQQQIAHGTTRRAYHASSCPGRARGLSGSAATARRAEHTGGPVVWQERTCCLLLSQRGRDQ